jgi:hypothetical protein
LSARIPSDKKEGPEIIWHRIKVPMTYGQVLT